MEEGIATPVFSSGESMSRIGEEAGWGSRWGSWGASAGVGAGPTVHRISELRHD